jgi:hypothetical protein
MADAKSVINLGLGKIAASRVVTLVPPKSAIERHCADGYPVWRDNELEIREWYFAVEHAQLTVSPLEGQIKPDDGRTYRYAVPNDMLRPIRDKRTEWQQRGAFIYSAQSTLILPYIARRVESVWPSLFIDVVACRVAKECVEFATQSNTKGDSAEMKYEKAVRNAARANAFVNGPIDARLDDANDEWILARMGTGITE